MNTYVSSSSSCSILLSACFRLFIFIIFFITGTTIISTFAIISNKNNVKIIKSIFEIIEPLFYIEKVIFFRKLKQHILFLPLKKKVKAILTILKQSTLKSKKNKLNNLSYNISQEILMSLFKTSNTYNSYKLQNVNFLK